MSSAARAGPPVAATTAASTGLITTRATKNPARLMHCCAMLNNPATSWVGAVVLTCWATWIRSRNAGFSNLRNPVKELIAANSLPCTTSRNPRRSS